MFTRGEKDVSMEETDEAGDWRECSFDRSFRRYLWGMGFVMM